MSTPETLNGLAAIFLNLPRNQWEEQTEHLYSGHAMTAARSASNASVLLAEISEYLEMRAGGMTHDAARKEADKTVKKVRKVLGYTFH